MKKTMIFSILLLIVILLMTAFDVSLLSVSPIKVPSDMLPNVLYVCPIKETSVWANISNNLIKISDVEEPYEYDYAMVTKNKDENGNVNPLYKVEDYGYSFKVKDQTLKIVTNSVSNTTLSS